jgi:hypothetical protein
VKELPTIPWQGVNVQAGFLDAFRAMKTLAMVNDKDRLFI